ncbi:hypothetical protein [Myroides odoratimimus]|uniref:DUF4393 domain-containing protein n=1 Tax=Myroides odoratimimus CIP 101113 TaxID=883154 RepID=A0AAV3F4H2_9FLAO|nr:hypothetical protein [Myroides odoratimimus]EHO13231.1 hypothetical protein HMPREF9715_01386 [Myroides odoratimimus CIP 101113]
MSKEIDLSTNEFDIAAMTAKSIFGAIPGVGSLLSELTSEIIPNQRFDRLIEYVKILNDKISQIPQDVLEIIKDDPYFIDLIEEGFVQASRAITKDRKEYIATIIYTGINNDEQKFIESKYLLKLLSELNELEIIILTSFYYYIGSEKASDFKNKHSNILKQRFIYEEEEDSLILSSDVQENYKEHLLRLGLLKREEKIDLKIKNGKQIVENKKGAYKITRLGGFLLKYAGITEHYNYIYEYNADKE